MKTLITHQSLLLIKKGLFALTLIFVIKDALKGATQAWMIIGVQKGGGASTYILSYFVLEEFLLVS